MHVVILFSLLVLCCNAHLTQEQDVDDAGADLNISLPSEGINEITAETAIQNIEELALTAQKYSKIGSTEESEVYYDAIIQNIDDIIYTITDTDYVYQFLKAKGISRVILNNLGIEYPKLRSKLLILLKLLFEIVPVTTNAVIPKSLITRLLDIFENDDNLALKANALDVLYKWLPNNPEVQIRVMKLKGLEPFYTQVHKLDITAIQTLLDLFNTILKEHVEARSGKAQETKLDHGKKIMYQTIGLLEKIETSNVCNGLVNIFQVVWAYNDKDEIVKTVFELVKNTKPFCGDILKGKNKALALFENLLKFVKNEDKTQLLGEIGLNATEFEYIIEDYVDKVKTDKDEF